MAMEHRATGIDAIGDVPWGTHLCILYETEADLLDTLISFFRAGLQSNERCLWILAGPIDKRLAIEALRQAIPEIDQHLAVGKLQISSYRAWYLRDGAFDLDRLIQRWSDNLAQALADGYSGIRACANEVWIKQQDLWEQFSAYEAQFHGMIAGRQMLVLCAYPLAETRATELFDLARTHQFAIARRHGRWEIVETPELTQTKEEMTRLNLELERRIEERTHALIETNAALRRAIAEHKQTAESLHVREAQLMDAQRLAQVGSWEWDIGTDTVTWSQELYRIWGMDLGTFDATYEAVLEMIHPLDRPLLQTVVENAFQAHEPYVIEHRIIRPDGSMRILQSRGAVVLDRSGQAVRMFGTSQDITEPREDEEERARLFGQVESSRKQLQLLSRQLLLAHEIERRTIARELHDEIGQQLTGLSFLLAAHQAQLPDLSEALALVRQLIDQVRNLALDLRPAMLDDLGLVPALVWLFERYTARTQVVVRFEHLGIDDQRFAPEVETTAYRVIQEALTNIARHSGVLEATVRLWVDAEMLVVAISDYGRGFDLEAIGSRSSVGLAGMDERVGLLGGSLVIESAQQRGTRIMATIPRSGDAEPPI